MSVTVSTIDKGSIAEELGIKPGDSILSVNSQDVRDSLDFLRADSLSELVIVWSDEEGVSQTGEVVKDEDEPLGVTLRADPVHACANRCIFCFVDQMPANLRSTLYVKDDDWRTSFLHGSYVTLTNLSEADIERIISEKVSPLYVSVHAADAEVRGKLLGISESDASLTVMRRLAEHGVTMHTQAVICPGVNDGRILENTIRELERMYPSVHSLSVVPVGLTSFRNGLEHVRAVSGPEAAGIVDMVTGLQEEFLCDVGTRFVFAADELYLKAGCPFPSPDAYEGFPQLDNGVGLVVDFLTEAGLALTDLSRHQRRRRWARRIGSVTGVSFAPVLREFCRKVRHRTGVPWEVSEVQNRFFGPSVTVTGLLTGEDTASLLSETDWDAAFLPDIMFRDTGNKTLDGMTIGDVESLSGLRCFKASSNVALFMDQLHQAAGGEEPWQSLS